LFQIGGSSPPIKHGREILTQGTSASITFSNAFPDADYTVSITPYSSAVSTDTPRAYVIVDASFTGEGFTVETLHATGFFWTAIYGSNS
jgi:hypothetical protein